ncbi:hypothetical protein NA57DRAFT_76780 [Rhizodiscina lignyota]|uniref:EthD domain-containing protein n=1 Tax=Rhizodiscina lignyota TaxID=1504668 RepID=A0A9P4IGW1_9PEZI|nr:hypothetical protein NA57DRAFT_76780 [Rhizodiscina lignyota]
MQSDPPRVPHAFSSPSLSYDTPPNKQPYVRINTFFKKKPGISYEYFVQHWHHVHADLVTSMKAFTDNNIVRYTQFFQTPEGREEAYKIGAPAMEWDACSEFLAEKVDDFAAFLKSEEYVNSLSDIDHFIDKDGGMRVMIGYTNLVYGKTIEGMGKDGVLREDLGKK